MRTPSPLTALAAALALGLGACSRDVTLPPEATAPRILSIEPSAAWAGERITIVATGLDAAAEANVVQFPSGLARGEGLSGSALVVRVPADAGSGQLAVQASGGVSPPAGPFVYRGLGQLRTGAIAGEVPLLHKPYRLLAAGGDTFLHSDLLLAAIRYADPTFARDLAVSVDALPWRGSEGAVAWLESEWNAPDAADVSRLVRLDVATGATAERELPFAGAGAIVALAGAADPSVGDRIAVLRSTDAGPTLAVHDAATLSEVVAEGPVPGVAEVRGCADAGAGRLACLVRDAPRAPLALAVLAPGAAPVAIALAPGDAIHEDAIDLADPVCAGRLSAGGARAAAVALEDGRIALASLGAAPAVLRYLETGSRTPARSLACAEPGGRLAVLAPKRADDLLVAVDAEAAPSGRILWSVPVPRASRAAFDASRGTVHAAGEADNRVLVVDAATGAVLARRSLDVMPGREGAIQAAAWITGDGASPPELVFAIGSPPGILELPLAAAAGTFPIFRNHPDAVGTFGPFAPDDPAYRYYFTLRAGGLAQSSDAWDFDAGAVPLLGQDGPRDAYVATAAGLVTIDYPRPAPGAPIPWVLSPIAGAEFVSLGLLPGDRVFGALRDGSGAWTVRAWTEDEAAAGAAAGLSWTAPGEIAAAALLDGVLWVFHRDAGGAFSGTQLGGALGLVRTLPLAEAFDRILAVSPNGRTFVTWEYQPYSWETSVVVWSAGGIGYARAATVPVPGVVAGVAFDGTGEALYVLTRGPDRVVVLE